MQIESNSFAVPVTRRLAIKPIIQVAAGNALEIYDLMIYGYYASYIGHAFFPSSNGYVSLMLTLTTFAVGFLARPFGAIVLGAYTDRHGRRKGLLLSLTLMCAGILSLACTPSYAQIGLMAPLIVVVGRVLQGFSAGAELGGVVVYLAEIAPPNRRAFYTCWQAGSQQFAVMAASIIGLVLLWRADAGPDARLGMAHPVVVWLCRYAGPVLAARGPGGDGCLCPQENHAQLWWDLQRPHQ